MSTASPKTLRTGYSFATGPEKIVSAIGDVNRVTRFGQSHAFGRTSKPCLRCSPGMPI